LENLVIWELIGQGESMQIDSGMIVVGVFLVIVAIVSVREQRRATKKQAADYSAYNAALAETQAQNRESVELHRETNRLLTLIAEKLDRNQK
jgi:hypothetical protein